MLKRHSDRFEEQDEDDQYLDELLNFKRISGDDDDYYDDDDDEFDSDYDDVEELVRDEISVMRVSSPVSAAETVVGFGAGSGRHSRNSGEMHGEIMVSKAALMSLAGEEEEEEEEEDDDDDEEVTFAVLSHPFSGTQFAEYFSSGKFADFQIIIRTHTNKNQETTLRVHRIVLDQFEFFRKHVRDSITDHMVLECKYECRDISAGDNKGCALTDQVWHSVVEFLYSGEMPQVQFAEPTDAQLDWYWFGLLQAAHMTRLERLFELVRIHFLEHIRDRRVSLISLGLLLDTAADPPEEEEDPTMVGNHVLQLQKVGHLRWFATWLRRFRNFGYLDTLSQRLKVVLQRCSSKELHACGLDEHFLAHVLEYS